MGPEGPTSPRGPIAPRDPVCPGGPSGPTKTSHPVNKLEATIATHAARTILLYRPEIEAFFDISDEMKFTIAN